MLIPGVADLIHYSITPDLIKPIRNRFRHVCLLIDAIPGSPVINSIPLIGGDLPGTSFPTGEGRPGFLEARLGILPASFRTLVCYLSRTTPKLRLQFIPLLAVTVQTHVKILQYASMKPFVLPE